MLFVGTSIIHPSTEGVFLLCNILDLLIYSYKLIFCFPKLVLSYHILFFVFLLFPYSFFSKYWLFLKIDFCFCH